MNIDPIDDYTKQELHKLFVSFFEDERSIILRASVQNHILVTRWKELDMVYYTTFFGEKSGISLFNVFLTETGKSILGFDEL